jgi:hypothetical protein
MKFENQNIFYPPPYLFGCKKGIKLRKSGRIDFYKDLIIKDLQNRRKMGEFEKL